MKKFFFILSGQNTNLSKYEILSIYKLKNLRVSEEKLIERLYILACEKDISKYLASRVALTHNISELLMSCTKEENTIIKSLKSINFDEIFKFQKTYAVRIQKIGQKSVNSEKFEKLIGKIITTRVKKRIRANLKNPEILFFGVFVKDQFFFGINREIKIRKGFNLRSFNERPFFHPTALNPVTARVMINLSQIKENETFLDPFCGTGSILIEAAKIGCEKVIGIDISQKMINGSKANIMRLNFNKINLILSDSNHIPLREVAAIATDPPYGRSSSTFKKSVPLLLENFFSEIKEIILKKRIISLALPSQIELSENIYKQNFEIIEKFEQYVHSSMTRIIYVIQKK